jgi:hypothetical protein
LVGRWGEGMTAKCKTGLCIPDASGADPGSTHSQLMKDHRRPGRPEGASIHSLNDEDDTQPTGELPQYRDRDEARKPPPAAEESPPMGEGPQAGPPSMPYQNTGEGPATDDGGGEHDRKD